MGEVKGSDTETEKDDGGGGAASSPSGLSTSENNYSDGADQTLISLQGRMIGPTRRASKGGWTEEEDKILATAVQKFKGKNWKKIAECIPNRTDVQCLHRWQKVLHPDLVKGPWTKKEDELIIELVSKNGSQKWSEIAKYLPGRIGKQCRERWYNNLNPEINRAPWTKEEELALISAHNTYGNQWAKIAKFLHGSYEEFGFNTSTCTPTGHRLRHTSSVMDGSLNGVHIVEPYLVRECVWTENSIKNHWNCSMKKKLESNPTTGILLSNPKEKKMEFETVKQKVGTTFPIERNMDSERIVDTSLRLDSKARENYFQSSKQGNCQIPRKGPNDLTTPPFREFRIPTSNSTLGVTLRFKNSKDLQTPRKSMEKNVGSLCYKPLQKEDLIFFMETGKFPNTDSYIRVPSSTPVSFRTPETTRERGKSSDFNSPGLVLRSAAMSFHTIPSIIRKRRVLKASSFSDCKLNAKKNFLSNPPKIQKVGNYEGKNSFEKRLEFAFDDVFGKMDRSHEGGDGSGAIS